jgi:hypothetical protein
MLWLGVRSWFSDCDIPYHFYFSIFYKSLSPKTEPFSSAWFVQRLWSKKSWNQNQTHITGRGKKMMNFLSSWTREEDVLTLEEMRRAYAWLLMLITTERTKFMLKLIWFPTIVLNFIVLLILLWHQINYSCSQHPTSHLFYASNIS